MNTFGQILRLTTAGESHGSCLIGILDGFPAGVKIDLAEIQQEMALRRPGAALTSPRREADNVEILSGLLDGISTGAPIALMIKNTDAKSESYEAIKNVYRPSHADFTYMAKYGIFDSAGGGRASARETALRVAAGALALQALKTLNITIAACTLQIGSVKYIKDWHGITQDIVTKTPLFAPDDEYAQCFEKELIRVRNQKDTIGGVVGCVIKNVPAGLGEPVYDKLHARLAYAMMSINAAHGFDYGAGFDGVTDKGSNLNDSYISQGGSIRPATNHSGGILGGISTGEDIYFRVMFKPIPTLMQPQKTMTHSGQETEILGGGRHDVCALPRAVPVVRAMAALTLLDAILLARSNRL